MENKEKVPSLELCRDLLKLKIMEDEFKTYFMWVRRENPETNWFGEWEIQPFNNIMQWLWDGIDDDSKKLNYSGVCHQEIRAPDLSEMGELLPVNFRSGKNSLQEFSAYIVLNDEYAMCGDPCRPEQCMAMSETEANARAKLLIALKENKENG